MEHVRIVEVGPRDGLQNESAHLSVDGKIAFITDLASAGIQSIEVGSFVSPRKVPAMANTPEVFAGLTRKPDTSYIALVPNMRGFAAALAANVRHLAVFVSATESFSQHNLGMSIDQSLECAAEVIEQAQSIGVPVRGYVSCVLNCPYEGAVPGRAVLKVARKLRDLGCYEISLGDTIGTGHPGSVRTLLELMIPEMGPTALAVHFHDTWGQSLPNILTSLELGIRTVDASVAGLGGCPYAPGASGNVATEDVLYMLHGMGFETGIDLARLAVVGQRICKALGRTSSSRVARAISARSGADPAAC